MTVSPQPLSRLPIRVEVATARLGLDLADALGRRGLVGRLQRREARWEVEIASRYEPTDSLLDEVTRALAEWLADRGEAGTVVYVGDEPRTVAAAVPV